jgi:ABC-type spermidine/putrescine transport system permease subunit II
VEDAVSDKVIATIIAVVIVVAAAYAMRKAGNALREQLKGGKR